jgi:hypothetical protein
MSSWNPTPRRAPAASASLVLTAAQVEALQQALQGYRQEALVHELPTAERNARLRLAQHLLGKLLAAASLSAGQRTLVLTAEEQAGLRSLLAAVRAQQTRPAPDPRTRWLAVLEAVEQRLEQP